MSSNLSPEQLQHARAGFVQSQQVRALFNQAEEAWQAALKAKAAITTPKTITACILAVETAEEATHNFAIAFTALHPLMQQGVAIALSMQDKEPGQAIAVQPPMERLAALARQLNLPYMDWANP